MRGSTRRTERLARRASAPASGSRWRNFAPKPPPIGIAVTLSSVSGIPSALAVEERTVNIDCVEQKICSLPSGSIAASAACVSR